MKRISVGVSFDRKTISKIDSVRGMVPRSRYIEKIILEAMVREAKLDGQTS